MVTQEYTSIKTSQPQIPACMKKILWTPGVVNLDFGGGSYDLGTKYLAAHRVENLILDLCKSDKHNSKIFQRLQVSPADTCTLANVLNVIKEPEARLSILFTIKSLVKTGGILYIQVYSGDKSGKGKPSTKGWQEHRKLESYLYEIQQVFPECVMTRGMIIAKV